MLLERMMRAARLDVNLYEEVEHDLNATSQAATVVGIVALAAGLGGAIAIAMGGQTGFAIVGFVAGVLMAFVSWIAWAYITYFIGTSLFKGQATPGELLRTIGFAQTPQVINILAFIPILGSIVGFVAWIWTIIASIVALRQALDISTGQAVITALIGAIPMFLLNCLFAFVLLGGGMATGAIR
ncbi:MAG TPA: YIP1 family protein [Chloroflexota bacterium]|nr:YIP1 family protein [Chloroflexota bacterium]